MLKDVRLFFPEVRRGDHVIEHPFDVEPLGLGDALRRRVRAIVARPLIGGVRPPGARGGDSVWHDVRRHHHQEFGMACTSRRPDERHVVALAHGIGEVVADALIRPVDEGLDGIKDTVARVGELAVNRDPWAPRRP
jgi:hypothetical protein